MLVKPFEILSKKHKIEHMFMWMGGVCNWVQLIYLSFLVGQNRNKGKESKTNQV